MFSFSVQEIDLYVGLDKDVLNAMASIEDSIASSIAASVIAYNGASVDVDTIASTEHAIATEQAFLNNDLFQDMLEGCDGNVAKVMDLVKWRETAPEQISMLGTERTALLSAKYDAFKEAWSATRTKGKTGPRDSIEGKVVSCDVNGETRIMKDVAHNIWRVYVRVAQPGGGFLDNILPDANSAEFSELSVKYASTAKRFMSAFGHKSKTSRTDPRTKVTTVYECDGSVDDMHRAMTDKSYGKLAFGGSVGIETVSEDASTWAPNNG